jgi:hypothetical protein
VLCSRCRYGVRARYCSVNTIVFRKRPKRTWSVCSRTQIYAPFTPSA